MLKNKFPTLWNFFPCWFSDADLEGISDEEAVRQFLAIRDYAQRSKLIDELKRLLQEDPLPVTEVSKEANRFFESEEECRIWLVDVLRWLEE